jgi:hypothetical protein
MEHREISKDCWKSYLDELSKSRGGQRVRVDVHTDDFGTCVTASDAPLMGIIANGHGLGHDRIEIIVGGSSDPHLTHPVDFPLAVRVAENGYDLSALQILAADGSRTTIHFTERQQQHQLVRAD